MDKVNQIIADFGNYLKQEESDLDRIGQQLDVIEEQIDLFLNNESQ